VSLSNTLNRNRKKSKTDKHYSSEEGEKRRNSLSTPSKHFVTGKTKSVTKAIMVLMMIIITLHGEGDTSQHLANLGCPLYDGHSITAR